MSLIIDIWRHIEVSHNIIIFLKSTHKKHAPYLLDLIHGHIWIVSNRSTLSILALIQGIFRGIVARKSQVFRTDVIIRRDRNNRRQRQQAGEQNRGLALCLQIDTHTCPFCILYIYPSSYFYLFLGSDRSSRYHSYHIITMSVCALSSYIIVIKSKVQTN